MTSRFSVDLERLDSVVARMGAFDTALDAHLEKLNARIGRLHTTWTGETAQAQHEAHEEWMRAARSMRQAQATLRGIAETAHSNYQAAVAANVRMWNDVS